MIHKTKPTTPMVLWTVWGAVFVSTIFYQFELGGGIPQGMDSGSPESVFLILSIAFIVIATGIRWVLIPRQRDLQKLLVLMIIGVALAQSVQFYQIFLIGERFPETQLSLFILSVIGVGQFVPFYAHRRGTPLRKPPSSRYQDP